MLYGHKEHRFVLFDILSHCFIYFCTIRYVFVLFDKFSCFLICFRGSFDFLKFIFSSIHEVLWKTFMLWFFMTNSKEKYVTLSGLNRIVNRCQATSKRTADQCRKAAMKGKQVCRAHGGCSTGPRTQQGRKRCAEARYQHGWETRKIRELRAQKFHEMKTLFSLIED